MMSFCFSFLTFLFRHPSFFILILLRLLLGEKTPAFLFSTSAKVEFLVLRSEKYLVKLIFSAQNEISGKKILRAEEKNTPKKVVFAPKVAESDEKGRFWGENDREWVKRKNGLNCRFCNAMK